MISDNSVVWGACDTDRLQKTHRRLRFGGLLMVCALLAPGFSLHAEGFSVVASGTWPACDFGNPDACGPPCSVSEVFKFQGSGIATIEVSIDPYWVGIPVYVQQFYGPPQNNWASSNWGNWWDGNDGTLTPLWSSTSGTNPANGNGIAGQTYRSTAQYRISNTTGKIEKRFAACPQRTYGSLGGWWQSASTNTVRMDFRPQPEDASTVWENRDQKGGAGDNPNSAFKPPPKCNPIGLPTYSVNTSFLNLVIEDTEFGCQSRGHDLAMRRVWNMDPGSVGMFGNGWSFEYESRLRVKAGLTGTVTLASGSGQSIDYVFDRSEAGDAGTTRITYKRFTPGIGPTLTAEINPSTGAGSYRLTNPWAKTTHVYEQAGSTPAGEQGYRLTQIKDRNGNTVRLGYDAADRLASITDTSGRETRFSYDANRRVTQMQTFDGRNASYAYDATGNLVRNVDLLGTVIEYSYDAQRYMTAMTVDGKTTTFAYATRDTGERYLASVTEPDARKFQYAFERGIPFNGGGWKMGSKVTEPGGAVIKYYPENGRTIGIVDRLKPTKITYNSQYLPVTINDHVHDPSVARITAMEYDANGNLTKLTDPAGQVTTLTYDEHFNLTSLTNALGQKTTYAYDNRDNLIGETTPLGRATAYTVDPQGQVTRITQPDGSRYSMAYDTHGNLTAITDPLGHTTTIGFDAQGLNPTALTDALGNTTGYSFDANRRLASIQQADGYRTQFERDCCSLTAIQDGAGQTTRYQRDAAYRLSKVTDPLGHAADFAYNADGDLIQVTDPLGQTTQTAYDPEHRPVSLTDPMGGKIQFGRDIFGRPTSLTDERGKVTKMSYDKRDLLGTIKDPLGKTTATYARDALGCITAITNARGDSISLVYDADGRLLEKKYQGATVAQYVWDANNQLVSVSDATGIKRYQRDAVGRVTRITYPDGKTIGFVYDANGNRTAVTYPDGLTATYTYDSLNRVASLSFAGNTLNLSYDSVGNLIGETRSNGVDSRYAYDAARRLIGVSHKRGEAVIADIQYTRNAGGLITRESGTWPLSAKRNFGDATATHDDANAIVTWNSDAYTHDADGNLTGITGSRSFAAQYDPENRPTAITRGGSTTQYAYDGLNNRVRGQSPSLTRQYYHDEDGTLLTDIDTTSNVVTHYIHAGSRLVAAGSTGKGYVFHHFDKTGNTLALTDTTGQVVGAYAYDAYGKVVARSGAVSTPFTYVGAYGVIEGAENLFFMRNRYYDASTGRFIQRDPIGFEGGYSSLYSYVGNSSVSFIDPNGLFQFKGTDHEWINDTKSVFEQMGAVVMATRPVDIMIDHFMHRAQKLGFTEKQANKLVEYNVAKWSYRFFRGESKRVTPACLMGYIYAFSMELQYVLDEYESLLEQKKELDLRAKGRLIHSN